MPDNSLPGYLKKVLEHHIAESELNDDSEMRSIVEKLDQLRANVEAIKQKARLKKAAR